MVRRPTVIVRRLPSFTKLKDLLLQMAWPIKAKFYVEPPWDGGTKVCSRHVGHMTKMAATPIYGKKTLAQGRVHTKIQTGFSQKLLCRSGPNFV